ncbi:MAG: DUF3352 domain-containing protein [Cyanobacteria bacterium J06554_3]
MAKDTDVDLAEKNSEASSPTNLADSINLTDSAEPETAKKSMFAPPFLSSFRLPGRLSKRLPGRLPRTEGSVKHDNKLADTPLKKTPKLLPLGAAILLTGGAIAYFNFSQRAPRSLVPAGTQLVPRSALVAMTLTTEELTWTRLRSFGTADSQEQFDGVLRQWKDRLFTLNGYSFKRDIKPWIGDRVTLAVLPAKETNASRQTDEGLAEATQNLILVVPIADAAKAKALLDRGPQTSATWQDRSYKGVGVKTIATQDGQTIETAVIGTEWLLLSNSADGIEQAIDTHKGRRSLLDNAGYRDAAIRAQPPQPVGKNFAQFYINIPAVTQALSPVSSTGGSRTRRRGSLIPLQGSEGLVATALVEPDGLRFQGTSWLSPKNDLAYGELNNDAGDMPRRLPGDTLLAMSGSNLQQFWEGFSEGNTSPPFFPDPQNLKAGLLTQTGLDIDEDIMPWAAGEFALGILPPVADVADADVADADVADADAVNSDSPEVNEPGSPEADPTTPVIESAPLLIMVQTNDRQMAENVWSQIDDVMVDRYRFQVETTEFDGGSITEWISPFQGVQFSHGWLPGNVAFFAVGDGAADAIAPSPTTTLASTRLFQTLTSAAPTPNNGHFYLDLAQINALEGVFPIPQFPREGPTTSIEAIGLTATLGNGEANPSRYRTMQYDLYLKLTKAARPAPL